MNARKEASRTVKDAKGTTERREPKATAPCWTMATIRAKFLYSIHQERRPPVSVRVLNTRTGFLAAQPPRGAPLTNRQTTLRYPGILAPAEQIRTKNSATAECCLRCV